MTIPVLIFIVDPQYHRSQDWRKNRGIEKTAIKGVIIIKKTHIQDLKMSSGNRYWGWVGGGKQRGGIGERGDC